MNHLVPICLLLLSSMQVFAAAPAAPPAPPEGEYLAETITKTTGLDGACLMKPMEVSASPYREGPRPKPPQLKFPDYIPSGVDPYGLRARKVLAWRGSARGHRFVVVKKYDMRARLDK